MNLSVVMSVYNGAGGLSRSIDSILAQTFSDFELIVVDDGSTDPTSDILARYAAADPRVKVIRQSNTGLTRALIRGCDAATGTYIARHDAGDLSMPERFARQVEMMGSGHVAGASFIRVVEEHGNLLFVSTFEGEEIRRSLLHDDGGHIHGLPHPASIFRRDAYQSVGGYRPQFAVAQDLDLWIRLAPLGTIGIVDEVLVEMLFSPSGISGAARQAQMQLKQLAVALRDGGDPSLLLRDAAAIRPSGARRGVDADTLYFIARCLLGQRNPAWRSYAVRAIRANPLHFRSWLSLIAGR